jgi:hypothetical protein
MSNKPVTVVYVLQGWREHVQKNVSGTTPPYSSWPAAGTLAAQVLSTVRERPPGWPSSSVWRRRLRRRGTDEVRLRRTFPALDGPVDRRGRQRLAAARSAVDTTQFADRLPAIGTPDRAITRQTKSKEGAFDIPFRFPWTHRGGQYRLDPCGSQFLMRAGGLWVMTAADAVYVSTVAGLARGTLRACTRCGMLQAFPRTGFPHKRCPQC